MAGKGCAVAETYLSQAIEAVSPSGAEYDTNAKYLLADKQILARILKYTVKEFQDMSVEDIISSIGADIEVGTRPLDPGLSNLGRVNVAGTEDNVPGEGIIINIRRGRNLKASQNRLIAMLETLLSAKDAAAKKQILTSEYGMVMTAELERRIQTMCNLSEGLIEEERLDAIERMLKINLTKEQILSCGYTEEEFEEAEKSLFANA